MTNENVFNLTECPRRLLVIGGGPLGCELAQAFCRFGSHVIIAQDDPMFLPKEERDAAQILSNSLARDGVEIHLNTTVVAVRMEGARENRRLRVVVATNSVFQSMKSLPASVGRPMSKV